jgi:hypothetical protein
MFSYQLFVSIHFTLVGEAGQCVKVFGLGGDIVHCEKFFGGSRIFTEKDIQFLKKSESSQRDVFFISDGSGDEVEHKKERV